ncbi:TetR family transcriptional regulator [Microbacterium sp. KSW2-21]|uniref:TetR family transcriptional regulator n=1 Tax=Microbacterium algihabitans TaxID=3075992 RepID=A0ABU3RTY4_9MICO|nr:TetR family transcriptional regulator [Microbacterium sp. KSW2-21]MDU0326372.1 TetR family transcriptional regulator [Microbacterium sp. KSW2-21]
MRRRVGLQAAATEQRRRAILDAAVQAFSEVGYNGTSLRDVAARAGLSHTGLLHHFPDKPGLLEAALDRLFDSTALEFDFASNDGVIVMRALIAAAERDVREPTSLRFLAVVTAESLVPSHPAHGFMRLMQQRVRETLTAAFTDLQERGLYRADPLTPSIAAVHAASLRNGAIAEWLRTPDEIDLVEIIRGQLRMFTTVEL